jgi:hypothetical protein
MLNLYRIFILFCLTIFSFSIVLSQGFFKTAQWQLSDAGGIEWNLSEKTDLPVSDHMAMSGMQVDLILEWRVDEDRAFFANKVIRWPMLRTLPNDTHASLQKSLKDRNGSQASINGKKLSSGKVSRVEINGLLSVTLNHPEGIESIRTIFPSAHAPAIIDSWRVTNKSNGTVNVTLPFVKSQIETEAKRGVLGAYLIENQLIGEGVYILAPGESIKYAVVHSARTEDAPPYYGNPEVELAGRLKFLDECSEKLVLETPDPVLNQLFAFSKIRATESIFTTRGGLMHGPGGYNKYLAAIWANDQAEYINPFFPFLGDAAGNESAMNSFRHFDRYRNDAYEPIPSSIIAEGTDYWNGAGDRGDMAMIAYGATRFALAAANPDWSDQLWPLIEWCLEYNNRKKLPEGVIASDSDELEGRFPAGEANLSTSCLYYDALISAAYLARELEKSEEVIEKYKEQAAELRLAIKRYFEAEVEGYDTYQYYEGNTELRSWICFPLTVGIHDKVDGTVDALFSPRLWTENGLLTKAGTITVWDRSTLYALRAVIGSEYAGEGMSRLHDFSKERLLGKHVPYVNEAYPEQNQSHLSAESGLYCRIFTEGLFGIRPTGWHSFECTPRLVSGWDQMALRDLHSFGTRWSLEVERKGTLLRTRIKNAMGTILYDQSLPAGSTHTIDFSKMN